MTAAIILQVVLIFLNAVFASAEIAVISINKTKLKMLVEEGDKRAKTLTLLTEKPEKFLATIQVAITLAGLLGSAFAADNFAKPLADVLVAAGVTFPKGLLNDLVVLLITLVLAYFNLVFGELVPKRLAMKKAESLGLAMSGMLGGVSKVFAPIVWLLTFSTNFILRILGINPNEEEEVVTEEEIRMLLEEGNEQGTIESDENEIIQNVFEFGDITVEEICIRRREIEYLSTEDSLDEWKQTIYETRHTYYPVCEGEIDDIIGVLDTRDYFRMDVITEESIKEEAMKPALTVPENLKAKKLLQEMRKSGFYFAIVLDEYGEVTGIVTLRDIMVSLVGDLDEVEEAAKPKEIEMLRDNCWKILGNAVLDDVGEELEVELPTEIYNTFNGFVCGEIKRVPKDGESFSFETEDLRIEVKGVENHVIVEAIVEKLIKETEGK